MSKTIVMIHGMWVSGESWENFRAYFTARGYDVHTPTLRYHEPQYRDAPPHILGTLSILDYVADIEEYIRSLPELPILFGHSMGGLIAQILASRGLCQSLILLAPAPPAGVVAIRASSIRTFWSTFQKWAFWRKPMRITFEEAQYGIMHLLPEAQQREKYETFGYESGHAASEIAFWALSKEKPTAVDPKSIKCQILVIAGAEDRIIPEPVIFQVAHRYYASYKVFPNHAHSLLHEPGWESIASYVQTWIEN